MNIPPHLLASALLPPSGADANQQPRRRPIPGDFLRAVSAPVPFSPNPSFNGAAISNYLRFASYQTEHSVNPETNARNPWGVTDASYLRHAVAQNPR